MDELFRAIDDWFLTDQGRLQVFQILTCRGRQREGWFTGEMMACLEGMRDVEIPCGALFYGKTRRRQEVMFDSALRLETENAAKELHELFESGRTPKPVYAKKCDSCSFLNLCLPRKMGRQQSVGKYLNDAMRGL